jgi:hypothetical protein
MLLKTAKVLHQSRYVTARDVARMILRNRRVCQTKTYLDCVTGWNEIRLLTSKLSPVLVQNDSLEDPTIFLEWYRQEYLRFKKGRD